MKRLSVCAVLCLAACDPEEVVADVAERTEEAGKAKAEAEAKSAAEAEAKAAEVEAAKAEAAAEAESKAAAVSACVEACDANTELSDDDRATCRLNCEPSEVPGSGEPGGGVVHAFTACIEGCASEGSATDTETCRLSCVSAGAVRFTKTGGGESEGAKACASACLTNVLKCQAPCDEAKGSEDDRATCRLRCTAEGGQCVDKCA